MLSWYSDRIPSKSACFWCPLLKLNKLTNSFQNPDNVFKSSIILVSQRGGKLNISSNGHNHLLLWSPLPDFSDPVLKDNRIWVAHHMVNGFFQQLLTHHDGRLGWVSLIKSPSCSYRGCSLFACLLCQTCGGCCRHMLCQTADRKGERGRGGISEDESVRRTRLGWKVTLS